MKPPEHVRVLALLIIGMIVALWISTNYVFSTGAIYLGFGVVAFLVYYTASDIFGR